MLEGVDVSYAQGDYRPGAEDFVIVNASRANIGLAVGSRYRNQVANARAAGKHVGHYFFNGNVDPVTCANFFVNNLDYRPADSLWLDVESERATSTVAWTPGQALAFINAVVARGLPTPGVYLNQSLMDGFNWSAVVATGAKLWIAYYNASPPPIAWWPTWSVWQYTSTPIDRNRAQGALTGTAAVTVKQEDDEMEKWEAFKVVGGNGSIYLSRNRAGYWALSGQSWTDYQSFFDAQGIKLGPKPSHVENVQSVINPSAFGPDLSPHPPVTLAASDVDALADRIVAKLPQSALTKQDVVDAFKAVTFRAE